MGIGSRRGWTIICIGCEDCALGFSAAGDQWLESLQGLIIVS